MSKREIEETTSRGKTDKKKSEKGELRRKQCHIVISTKS